MITDLGFYSVNDKNFYTNKIAAILEAQKTNSEVKWYFFDDEFNKVDWLTEPTLSLDELYRLRAQQIRDSYDYVVIYASGGADSTNVIRTFLKNNIHIDEVIAEIPESGLKNFKWDDTDFDPSNMMSETKYAQYPILHEVATKSPNTKITVHDFFQDIVNMESDEWIYQTEGDVISMSNYNYGRMDSFPHLKNLADQGKRIASVWGTDKPIIIYTLEGDVYAGIADAPVYISNYPFKIIYPNVNRVLFYWSHEFPDLMVKQAHVVAKELQKPENKSIFYAAIDQGRRAQKVNQDNQNTDTALKHIFETAADKTVTYSSKTVYQRGVVPFIYSNTFDSNVFQSNKFEQSQTFLPAFSNWITSLHGDSRIREMIISDFSLFYKNISTKYLNPSKTGFNPCIKRFRIGHMKEFAPNKK